MSHAQPDVLQCAACGRSNPTEALFCRQCTAPLTVAALQELDDEDRRMCLRMLLEVLAEGSGLQPKPVGDEELWNAYLSAFWLRPETALVLYAEALALRAMAGTLRPPWLDLGCGDGVHAALYSGWRFDDGFDVFQSLDLSACDIYDAWDPEDFSVQVVQRGQPIAHGADIKDTAAARAAALGVFDRVDCCDASALPLGDRGIGVIFSNMLRDLGAPLGAALDECRRVLRDDGTLLISAMTPDYPRQLVFSPAARQAELQGNDELARRFLRLDRGRSVFCQRQLSAEQWSRVLAEHGLRLEAVRPLVGARVIRFWDIGLRPFSLLLLRRREEWRRVAALAQIKASSLELLSRLLGPLVARVGEGESGMNLLVARKA